MEKEFVPYDRALKLKALGFDEPCFKCKVIGQEHLDYTPSDYDDFPEQKEVEVLIPTFSQAFRWFREKHNLFGKVYITNFGGDEYSFNIYDLYEEEYKYENFIGASMSYAGTFEAYEEAELDCLDKLIEIVQSKSE